MSGYKPILDDLIISRSGDYAHRYQIADGDTGFPDGTTAQIVITATNETTATILATWDAIDVTESYIEFWVQAPALDAIKTGFRYRLIVHYPAEAPATEGLDFVWYIGKIKRVQ